MVLVSVSLFYLDLSLLAASLLSYTVDNSFTAIIAFISDALIDFVPLGEIYTCWRASPDLPLCTADLFSFIFWSSKIICSLLPSLDGKASLAFGLRSRWAGLGILF